MVTFLYRRAHPRIIEVALHGDGTLRDRARFGLPPLAPDLLAVRMDSALNFLTAAALERFIVDKQSKDPALGRVLLSASGINDIDSSGVNVLESLVQSLQGQGIDFYLSAVKKQVGEVLDRAGLIMLLGSDRIFSTDRLAISGMVDRKSIVDAS